MINKQIIKQKYDIGEFVTDVLLTDDGIEEYQDLVDSLVIAYEDSENPDMQDKPNR